MRELTKAQEEAADKSFADASVDRGKMLSTDFYHGFRAALDYVESQRCRWTPFYMMNGDLAYRTDCGHEYYDVEVPCPFCQKGRIEVVEMKS